MDQDRRIIVFYTDNPRDRAHGRVFFGHYLKTKFGLPSYTYAICVVIGFVASVRETIRIIKLALRTEKRA